MWNLRANSDVLDDTWWESGGNDLWKQYARKDNINRETNTMFLTDEEWEKFEAKAEKIPGWVGVDPYPLDNPLWAAKQCISLYICIDPWVWLQSIDSKARDFCKSAWEKGDKKIKKAITEYVNECIDQVIKDETSRWELFGIVPVKTKRMYGMNRVIAEWQDEYTNKFWKSMRMICVKAGTEFSAELHRLLNIKLVSLAQSNKPKPEKEDKFSSWEWLSAGQDDDDEDDYKNDDEEDTDDDDDD